jgi:hypothetical protein
MKGKKVSILRIKFKGQCIKPCNSRKKFFTLPEKTNYTHASKEPRSLMIRSEQTYVALQDARRCQQTPAFYVSLSLSSWQFDTSN